jgi:hypothetical protein
VREIDRLNINRMHTCDVFAIHKLRSPESCFAAGGVSLNETLEEKRTLADEHAALEISVQEASATVIDNEFFAQDSAIHGIKQRLTTTEGAGIGDATPHVAATHEAS